MNPAAGRLPIFSGELQQMFRNKLRGPFSAENLGLLQDKFRGFVLQVWRVAVFAKDAFDQNLDFRAGAFAQSPIDGHAFANLSDQLSGDDF